MSILITAIVNHDLDGIAQVIREHPELAYKRQQNWLPIEWAARTGNIVTYARSCRLLYTPNIDIDYGPLLKRYLDVLSSNYFGSVEATKSACRVWE